MTQETTTTSNNNHHNNNTRGREVIGNRSDIIKNKNMLTIRCVNTGGQKCHAKRSRKEIKMEEFICGDKTNGEHEMCDRTSNNWSHRSSNKGLQKNWELIAAIYSIDLLQKTAILGTSYIIRKVLQGDN